MRRGLALLSLCALSLSGAGRAFAQTPDAPLGAGEPAGENVDDSVARALFEQGLRLFHQHRYTEARQLFAESLARSPDGTYSRSARQMLTRCDERTGAGAPVDPYAAPDAPEGPPAEPVDPYAAEAAPVDPYETPASGAPGDARREVGHGFGADARLASREPDEDDLTLVSSVGGLGLLGGFLLGVAVHPEDERGYALTSALGASAGLATGLWIASRADVPERRMGYLDLAVSGGAVAPWIYFALAGGDGGDAATVQLTGIASLAMGAAGGWLGWYWTRDLGPAPGAASAAAGRASAPSALLQRSTRGVWRLSAVAPRPLVLAPAAADPRPRVGLVIDLVSGAF